jgi:hypothetical protein
MPIKFASITINLFAVTTTITTIVQFKIIMTKEINFITNLLNLKKFRNEELHCHFSLCFY